MSKQGRKANYTSITGMWKQNGKVAFSGRVTEDITIPAGTKILAFHGEPEEGYARGQGLRSDHPRRRPLLQRERLRRAARGWVHAGVRADDRQRALDADT